MVYEGAGNQDLAATMSTLVGPDELLAGGSDLLQRCARAVDVARRWLTSTPLRNLVNSVGNGSDDIWRAAAPEVDDDGRVSPTEVVPSWAMDLLRGGEGVPASLLPAVDLLRLVLPLERWAASHFDFRGADRTGYRERNQAVQGNFDSATVQAIKRYTTALGLRGHTRPHHPTYDHTLVLGGGWLSPLLRARYTARWLAAGVDPGRLFFLGSPRPLSAPQTKDGEPPVPPERSTTEDYAPGAVDEFDLLAAAASREFSVSAGRTTMVCGCSSISERCPAWKGRLSPRATETPARFTHERSLSLNDADGAEWGVVLSASTGQPPDRPNTTDTLELWSRLARPEPGSRVLVVTTQVFVPFQTFDSLRRLYVERDVDIDVIGYGADWGDRPDNPEYLVQETLSGIRSARRLLVDALAHVVS